jgi:hypothetical protein
LVLRPKRQRALDHRSCVTTAVSPVEVGAVTDDFGTQYWKARLEVNGARQTVFVNENDEVGDATFQSHTQMGDRGHGMDAYFAPFVFTPYEIQPKIAFEHGGVANVSEIGGHFWDNSPRYDGQQDPGVAFEGMAYDFLRMVAPESEPDTKVVFGDGKSMVVLRSGAPSNVAMLNQAGLIFGFTGIPGTGDIAAPEPADLQPYGEGGGHHTPAKSMFRGDPVFNANTALAIPNAELARLGIRHIDITAAQQIGYRAFAQTGATLTWQAAEEIESQALVRAGMDANMARSTVQKAIKSLKADGVSGPTRIPWGK